MTPRLKFALVTLAVVAVFAVKLGVRSQRSQEEAPTARAGVVSVRDSDDAMNAAMARGRDSLPELMKALDAHAGQRIAASLKVRFTQEETTEYMWVALTGVEATGLRGVLTNEPYQLTNVRQGDELFVDVDDVVDWSFRAEGEPPLGNFTTCELLARAANDPVLQERAAAEPRMCDWARSYRTPAVPAH